MEDITDVDCVHAKRVCKDFETEHFGEYHDLYIQSDTLLYVLVMSRTRFRVNPHSIRSRREI